MFIGLLTGLGKGSNHAKCVFLTNQKCTTQPTIFNLHLSEYTQGLHYYPFVVNLDRCNVILLMTCLIKCVFQIKQDLNLSMFNMITEINESKILTKHTSCKI